MPFRDSVDKIVTAYFASVTRENFYYKGIDYLPRSLRVSEGVVRGYTCPPLCGGCCPRFSLDYLPSEKRPKGVTKARGVGFNGKVVVVDTDTQDDHNDHHCRNLEPEDGRCGIHKSRPFSCDFELIRFMQSGDGERANMTTKLFGRGWAMLRVDKESRGALCTVTPTTAASIKDTVRKLTRLKQWTDHFGLRKTYTPEIIAWIEDKGFERGPLHLKP